MENPTATLILKPGREKPVHNRHPWIFSGAIGRMQGQPAPGDLVTVADQKGAPLATAYYNAKSQIQARILSWNTAESIDENFWRGRLQQAIDGRKAITNDELRMTNSDTKDEIRDTSEEGLITDAYRLVNAEADGLPGLVAPATLVFYGLALFNASKFTLDDIIVKLLGSP